MTDLPISIAAVAQAVEADAGVTAWMMTSTALVLLMVPGLALFYGGLVRTKNVLGTMMHSFVAMAIIGVSWVVVGYALTFGEQTQILGGVLGWDSELFMLRKFDSDANAVTDGLPNLVFVMFQGKFAIIAPALIAGAFAERVKFSSYCVFIGLWSLFVYAPLAHMIWGPGGLVSGDAIDLAGGTVIHIAAGVAGLVSALYIGARRGFPRSAMHPNNLVMVMLGAGLLWVGWFGFNSGSTIASNAETGRALAMTQIAAASGALSWVVIESIRHKKASSLGLVSGILAGLVAITPAAGAVTTTGAVVLGLIAAPACYGALKLKAKLGYDDSLDVFGIHGVAGIVGGLALMLFLRPDFLGDKSWGEQLWHQVEGMGLAILVSGVVTGLLLVAIDKTMGLRLSREDEQAGLDFAAHGEHGYGYLNLN